VRGEDAVELVEVAGVVGDQGPRPHHRLVPVERRQRPTRDRAAIITGSCLSNAARD